MHRRHAIQLLGAAAVTPLWQISAQTPAAPFPNGAVIRTLLKDLSPDALAGGAVLFHEHLSNLWPIGSTTSFTDDVDLMIEETRTAGKEGVTCIVDGGHPDMGRKIDALNRIASQSGVHIVASGGYYMQRTLPGRDQDEVRGSDRRRPRRRSGRAAARRAGRDRPADRRR